MMNKLRINNAGLGVFRRQVDEKRQNQNPNQRSPFNFKSRELKTDLFQSSTAKEEQTPANQVRSRFATLFNHCNSAKTFVLGRSAPLLNFGKSTKEQMVSFGQKVKERTSNSLNRFNDIGKIDFRTLFPTLHSEAQAYSDRKEVAALKQEPVENLRQRFLELTA